VLKDKSERNETVATAPSQGVANNLAHDEVELFAAKASRPKGSLIMAGAAGLRLSAQHDNKNRSV